MNDNQAAGRTHQLRVAMKSLGSPILGDMLYANSADAKLEDRCYLHAAAIRLALGSEVLQVICPPVGPGMGSLFNDAAFQAKFDALLPAALEHQAGTWEFPGQSPLLTSTIGSIGELELRSQSEDGSGDASTACDVSDGGEDEWEFGGLDDAASE
mmetsp:Transcript_5297/g.11598  ORF Transcript_5297/g.11598 Transcript_5297/m.11598 type:complete len:155 (+) Transcript_5297:12-476(+)